jgi:MFS family permease
VPNSWRVIGRIARDRQLRRIEIGFVGFAIAEHGTWLAGIMYAYDRGGVEEAGIVAVILLAPALVVAPFAAFAADRFDGGRVLAAGYAIQAVAMLLTALAITADIGSWPVYAAAMVASASVTLTRPALGAVLPNITHTPVDLTAANVVMGFVEYSGMFIGPALTGILVGISGLAAPFAVCGGLTAGAALLGFGVRTQRGDAGGTRWSGDAAGPSTSAEREDRPVLRDTVAGLRALRGQSTVRLAIGTLALGSLVIGAADVLFVATADHLTGGDTAHAGLFGSATGAGALVGSSLTILLVGRARLTPAIAMAIMTMGLSLTLLATAGSTGVALLLFVVMGGGESVLRVSASTLIQRVAPLDVVGRFFGVVEGLHMFAIAVGSGAIGLLIAHLGYRVGLLAAGFTVTILLLIRIPKLFSVDRGAVAPDERVLDLILGDDIFRALPAPTIERLVADLERRAASAGETVIVEGAHGDRYYLIESGRVDVTIGGDHISDLGPGAGFGELALLRDAPRFATVTARTDVRLFAFEREHFLQAVTGHARSAAVGRERSERYLGPATD